MGSSVRRGRASLVGIAVATALHGMVSSMAAQAAEAAPAEETELEAGVVTGSHIRRTDLEKIVPITVIDEGAMESRNAVMPSDLLTSLPSVVNLPAERDPPGSSGARGDNANVNMRGPGCQRPR